MLAPASAVCAPIMEPLSQNDSLPSKSSPVKHADSPLEHAVYANEPPSSIPLVEVFPEQGVPPMQDVTSQSASRHELRTNIHFTTLCFCLFLVGWNDGTVGPLLPRIQGVYHVRPRRSSREACFVDSVRSGRIHGGFSNIHIQRNRKNWNILRSLGPPTML